MDEQSPIVPEFIDASPSVAEAVVSDARASGLLTPNELRELFELREQNELHNVALLDLRARGVQLEVAFTELSTRIAKLEQFLGFK